MKNNNKKIQCLEIKFDESADVDEELVDEINNEFMKLLSYYEEIIDLHYFYEDEGVV